MPWRSVLSTTAPTNRFQSHDALLWKRCQGTENDLPANERTVSQVTTADVAHHALHAAVSVIMRVEYRKPNSAR